MSEYIMMIISVSVVCAFVRILSPNSKELSFALKLVLICVVCIPLISFIGKNDIREDLFVINEEGEHSISNEDADKVWKRWTAERTAESLSKEISERIFETFRIEAEVKVPWYEEGENIIFGIIEIYAECDSNKCADIENWIRLHYSLDSICTSEDVDDG